MCCNAFPAKANLEKHISRVHANGSLASNSEVNITTKARLFYDL